MAPRGPRVIGIVGWNIIKQLYLVGGWPTPQNKYKSQLGWLFPIYEEKNMFQTTNQNISWWSSPRVHLYHVLVGGVNHLEKILVNGKDYPIYSAKIKRMFRTTNQLLYVFNRESASCNVWYLYAVILPNREIPHGGFLKWGYPQIIQIRTWGSSILGNHYATY